MKDLQIMLNEIRTRFGPHYVTRAINVGGVLRTEIRVLGDDWCPHIAMAERMYENGDRHGLTTLYDMMMGGWKPWNTLNAAIVINQARKATNDK